MNTYVRRQNVISNSRKAHAYENKTKRYEESQQIQNAHVCIRVGCPWRELNYYRRKNHRPNHNTQELAHDIPAAWSNHVL